MRSVRAYESGLEEALKLMRLEDALLKEINRSGTNDMNGSVIEYVTPESLLYVKRVNAHKESLRFLTEDNANLFNNSVLVKLKLIGLGTADDPNLNDKGNYQPKEEKKPDIQSRKSAFFSSIQRFFHRFSIPNNQKSEYAV